jgi:hypothetical protein
MAPVQRKVSEEHRAQRWSCENRRRIRSDRPKCGRAAEGWLFSRLQVSFPSTAEAFAAEKLCQRSFSLAP